MLSKSAYSWLVIWLAICLSTSSCVNKKKSVAIQNIQQPLRVVHKAVRYALTAAVKKRSRNNRVYFSKYHTVGTNPAKPASGLSTRGQVVIAILGDRRPYSVEAVYRIETSNGKSFKLLRYDKKLAQSYLDLVEEYLASRPDGVDMIDGFRPY